RTSIGCYERTLALLIEKYAGALPTWIAPVQVKVLPIVDKHHDYARQVAGKLQDAGIRAEVDYRNEKIGYKIREAQMEKVPYMLVLGDKEAENGQVAVRSRKDGDLGPMLLDDFIARITEEVRSKAK
ncbi:MAG TPA: His/Gly/Thr/Pro-type tRNA ligase C-terminal domain-containing protein, partial [Clostridiales bacterium]|nr:His/Gly/Thr/Pro-type tRNA ligase C-terminal domain-containing protein [Clostridiales bacterium]